MSKDPYNSASDPPATDVVPWEETVETVILETPTEQLFKPCVRGNDTCPIDCCTYGRTP